MPRKRSSGDGGLYYDKKRELWIGVVQNGFKPNGTRNQIRRTSKTQSGARAKLDQLKAEIALHRSPLGNQTVAQWGASWFPTILAKKPGTYRSYISVYKMWIEPVIGRKDLKDVLPSDLRKIYTNIMSAGKSGSTALKAHTVMSSMFEDARLERLVPSNVAKDIKPPKALRAERGSLSRDETAHLLAIADTLPDGTKWELSLTGGIRQGERLGATIDSIDFERGLFIIKWNLVEGNYDHGCGGVCGKKAAGYCPQKRLVIPDGMEYRRLNGRYLLVPPKSGEARAVPLSPEMLNKLMRQVTRVEAEPSPYGLLWPDKDGLPVSPRADQEQWRSLLVAAGIDRPDVTTHWARHTAISDMTALGIPQRVIGEIVGHKSAGVTGLYEHVSSQDAADAMAKLVERRQLDQ